MLFAANLETTQESAARTIFCKLNKAERFASDSRAGTIWLIDFKNSGKLPF